MAYSGPSNKSTSDLVTAAHWNQDVVANIVALADGVIIITVDGNGSVPSTGIVARLSVPKPLTITQVTLLADVSGSIVFDVWVDSYANYPPTVADTITASAKPTITTALKSRDGTLTGWTTSLNSGDTVIINLDSITTITYCTMMLKVKQN